MASSSPHGGQQRNNDGGGGGGSVVDCAACRFRGKKCRRRCIVAPHFPGNDSGIRDFLEVENVFGLANIRKRLEWLNLASQKEVVKSLKWEARLWVQHPIRGPYRYHYSIMQQQSLAMSQQQLTVLQQNHHLQQFMALRQRQQQQPVLLPSDGNGNRRMGGHHHQDHHQDHHHMTIQENNTTTSQANFPNPVVFPDYQQQEMGQVGGGGSRNGVGIVPDLNFPAPVGGGQEIIGQLGGRSSSRAGGGEYHQHGQSYQQRTQYKHHPYVFGSEQGRAHRLPEGSWKRSRE